MEFRREIYKNSRSNLDRARARCSEILSKARMENRMNILLSRRNMVEMPPQVATEKTRNHRVEMLAKWKANKEKAIMEEKKNKKPVFRAGILQRKATGSPLLNLANTHAEKNFLNPEQISKVNKFRKEGVITRSKGKILKAENKENICQISSLSQMVNNKREQIKNYPFIVPKAVSELSAKLKITIPKSPRITKYNKKKLKMKKTEKEIPLEMASIHELKKDIFGKKDLKNNILLGTDEIKNKHKNESVIENCETESKEEFIPIHYSPYVNKSRGMDCPVKNKINLTINVDELIQKEENEFKCRIFSFRKYIEGQSNQLWEKCNAWKNILNEVKDVPQDVEEEILSLSGKTTLLTTDKFMQFKDLIDKCENGDPKVKAEDLQGYQDWVSIEVEKLEEAFLKLEKRKENNWMENNPKPQKCKIRKEPKPMKSKCTKKGGAFKSNIREHILAARKLKENANDLSSYSKLDTWKEATPKTQNFSQDASNSAKKNATPFQDSPNTFPLNSDRKKHISGIEIMVATQLAKSLTPGKSMSRKLCEDNVVQINECVTPLKSILKQMPGSLSSSKRSVQFKLSKSNGTLKGKKLSEKYFEPLEDEEENSFDLVTKINDFTLSSPKNRKKRRFVDTPIRRSERLAMKLFSGQD